MRTRSRIVCGGFVLLLGWAAVVAQPDPAEKPRKGIDPETIAAYRKLGGMYGGWLKGRDEIWDFQPKPEIAQRGVPGFRFYGSLKEKLPAVEVPFGLELPHVKDADLKNLAHLSSLIELHFGSNVTNAGLKELVPLTGLRELNLTGMGITDEGLKDLARLKNLTYLSLYYTGVTGPGLKDLAPLQELATLNLAGCKVNDAALKDLAPLKKLSWLNLSSTHVTDAGLKELAALPNLTRLHLDFQKITDKGLRELAACKNLRFLQISGANVSEEAVKELQKALPKLRVN
jgi:hypothetical protein